ncbi:MAG: hypothetical protein J6J60_00650 [Clostridia bacterium]|nr:hypothetical protein [Clostridia bacterium]
MITDEKVSKIINEILLHENIETACKFFDFERFEREVLGRYFDDSNIRTTLLLTPKNLLKYVENTKRVATCSKKEEKLIEETKKKIEDWITLYEGDTTIECYKYLEKKMKELDKIFRKQTKKAGKEESLQLAGAKVAGIELRNLQRENNNLDGEIEKIPYTKEQEEMIDNYYKMERALEILDKYLEENYEQQEDDEEEM